MRTDRDLSGTDSSEESCGDEASTAGAGRRAIQAAALEIGPGDCLGRYTIRELIGAGGMGRVFAAVDPELGRTVAIKLIRAERPSPHARARLLREAQALARVHHPNVVTVHDVGTQGNHVFVAMELIEGSTAAEWLRSTAPTWRKVLDTFMAAGRGLAAAHAAGIVHRDFKPENVIVGADRVVVVDFGLARAGSDDGESEEPTPQDRILEVSVTATGERVGTPLYMSPEQRAGAAVTASSDQYSFCVALWQALHGEPPAEAAEAADAPDAADAPRRAQVPAWVNRTVQRGLARDPSQRWPSMTSLLAALARDPAKRRRQIAIGVAAGLLVAGALATSGLFSERVDPCGGAEARLAGVWDGARRQAVQQAFLATRMSYADDTWRRTSARLDAYAAGWVDMYGETCRATRVEGRQSDTMMDLRMRCLEQRRARIGALAEVWSRGMDAAAVEHAIAATDSLGSLPECADTRALAERAPLPADPALVAKIARTRARIDVAQSLRLAYRLTDARAEVSAARADADATGWPQLQAEAASAEGDVLTVLLEPREAQWLAASRLAFAAHDDRLAARALVGLTFYLANDDNKAERALIVADVADGVVTRSGGDDALSIELERCRGDALRIRGKLAAARSAYAASYAAAVKSVGPNSFPALRARLRMTDVASALGEFAEARRIGEENLTATIAALGPLHPAVGSQLNSLGNAASNDGNLEAGAGYYRRALAVFEKVYAPDAVSTALTAKNLATTEINLGQLAAAEQLLPRVEQALTRSLGGDHVEVARALEATAMLRRKQGRFDEAQAAVERALEIRRKVQGASHAGLAYPLEELGFEDMARGDPARALVAYQQVLEIRLKALGPGHALTLVSTSRVAGALAMMGRCREAAPLVATAITGLEKLEDSVQPYLSEALTVRGTCDLAQGRAQAAATALSRALDIWVKAHGSPLDRGATRWPLARALWALGNRQAAVDAARTAENELGSDADGARDRAAAHAWLITHAPG